MIIVPLCFSCRFVDPGLNENDDLTCKAFPNGIPQEITDGFDHTNRYPGDNGVTFESSDDVSKSLDLKFNPYHSSADGRFVSGPAGDYSGGGGGPSQEEMMQQFLSQARAEGLDTSQIDGTIAADDRVLTDPEAVLNQFVDGLPRYESRPYRDDEIPDKSGYALIAQYRDVKRKDGTTELMHTHDNVEFVYGKDFDRNNMSFSEPGTANAVNLSQQKLWEIQNEPYLRMEAARRGLSVNQLRSELQTAVDARVASDLASGGVFTRVPNSTLDHILADGRFKNQFESNRSKGNLNQELRANFEHTMWGYKKPAPPEGQRYQSGMAGSQRRTFDGAVEHAGNPLYGYLDFRPTGGTTPGLKVSKDSFDGDWLDQYGPISVKMKPSVLPRTSWSSTDTFTYKQASSPILSPSYRSALPTSLSDYGATSIQNLAVPRMKLRVPEGKESSLPWYKEGRSLTSDYMKKSEGNRAVSSILSRDRSHGDYSGGEVQFHGGLSVSDIERVYLPSKPSAKTRTALDAAGVPWEVVGGGAKSLDLFEVKYNRAHDRRGRFTTTGSSGGFRVENGLDHYRDVAGTWEADSINTVFIAQDHIIDWGPRKGEWASDHRVRDASDLRVIDPDERHLTIDSSWPKSYTRTADRANELSAAHKTIAKGDLLLDTSPDNVAGINKSALHYWSEPGKSARDKGGVGHQSYIQDGAARQLGMDVRGPNSSILDPKTDAQYEQWSKNLVNKIDESPASQPTLWRGIEGTHYSTGKSNASELKGFKPGQEFDVPLMSTSRDANVVGSYGSDVILRIKPGSKGIANRDWFEHDQEVITGGRFKVLGVDSNDKMTVVSVEQVGTWKIP